MADDTVIALLTDFGAQDPFVGIMKGVIASIAPQARCIDLNHQLPPGDLRRAGLQLWQARDFFPAGTVFLCVVDPGVGTSRKGIVVDSRGYRFIGPDNGIFSFVLDSRASIFELSNSTFQLPDPSATFHGRDIFAPAAAHLAAGISPARFGNQVLSPVVQPEPLFSIVSETNPDRAEITGEVLYPDRFGNLLTSLGKFTSLGSQIKLNPWLGRHLVSPAPFSLDRAQLTLEDDRTLSLVQTFAEIPEGGCAALIGSSGLLEIAVRGASAAEILGFSGGEIVVLHADATQ